MLLGLLLLIIAGGSPLPQAAQAAMRRPVLVEGKKHLYLRVLTRPQAALYGGKNGNGPVIEGNVPAFRAFYVYTRPSAAEREAQTGWYEVGSDDRGTVRGWMKASDLFEWEQTLCLAYSHPQGRDPVLFFDSDNALKTLLDSPEEQRKAKAEALYQSIRSSTIPSGFPVISMEPANYIDPQKEFYLLPILAYQRATVGDFKGRLLKVASVVASGADARVSDDFRHNDTYRGAAVETPDAVGRSALSHMKMDIVWVIDTTQSTQPYIESTLAAADEASRQIAEAGEQVGNTVRFGVWGFRAPTNTKPGIEYDTRNYTPSLLSIDNFRQTLSTIKAATVSTGDWEEDVFTGMRDAITKTKWRDEALRFVILVGDAPGHEPGHPKNGSNLGLEGVRSLANASKVSIFSIYIADPRAKQYLEKGEGQFSSLATNPGVGAAASCVVDSSDQQGVARETMNLLGRSVVQVNRIAQGELPPVMTEAPTDAVGRTLRAAIVQWIGTQAQARAPRDVTGWVTDKDLVEPAITSLNIKLLVTKRQLSALTEALSQLTAIIPQDQNQSGDLFNSLQGVVGTQVRVPENLREADALVKSKIIPEFIQGLPYQSRLLSWNLESWKYEMSSDDQAAFLNDLRAKISYYKELASSDVWVKINPTDDADDAVHALDFTQLP